MKRRVVKNKKALAKKAIIVPRDKIGVAFTRLLTKTIHQRKGAVGFAGNQVGMTEHVFTALIKGKWQFYANAKIIHKSDEKVTLGEGCLSIPNKVFKITRYNHITIEHETKEAGVITADFFGYEARIIQHEIDHLNGILIEGLHDNGL